MTSRLVARATQIWRAATQGACRAFCAVGQHENSGAASGLGTEEPDSQVPQTALHKYQPKTRLGALYRKRELYGKEPSFRYSPPRRRHVNKRGVVLQTPPNPEEEKAAKAALAAAEAAKVFSRRKALRTYENVRAKGKTPSIKATVAALRACGSYKDLETGIRIHSLVGFAYDPNNEIAETLVSMYAKCGDLQQAEQLLDKMPKRTAWSWNSIIRGFLRCGDEKMALILFERMKDEVEPIGATFRAALRACSQLAEKGDDDEGSCLKKVEALHSQILKCVPQMDDRLATALIQAYLKCGSSEKARAVSETLFQVVQEDKAPDLKRLEA